MGASDLSECRRILGEIKNRQTPVAGGSGGTGRYEMHDTFLYFELGVVLDNICKKAQIPNEKKLEYVRQITKDLKKEYDLHDTTHVFTSSLNFVSSFRDLDYFKHVSKVCGDTMKRIEAAELIFAKDNPAKISNKDLRDFEQRLLSGELTYKEMQKACTELRRKYEGSDADIDYSAAFHSFEAVMDCVDTALNGNAKTREKLRKETSEISTPVRYLLQLLAREDIFQKKIQEYKRKLPPITSRSLEFSELYKHLRGFLSASKMARDRLRKKINPYDMGQLQNKIRAAESEENYEDFKKTQEIFEKLQL